VTAGLLCVDTSAWHRAAHPAVATAWGTELAADRLGLCEQVRLEILYSVRSASDYEALDDELSSLVVIPITDATWERAREVQRRLAHFRGLHHRSVKIADLVIAAAAEKADATVWHYDEDFERIAAITGQPISWIAPRGSL
jgi:predicted nucleic acid-binding protein